MNKERNNPWKIEDEKAHTFSTQEWWCLESFFDSIEDKKKWCLRAYLWEWTENSKKNWSLFNFTLFDLTTKKHIKYNPRRATLLEKAKDRFDVRFEDSFIRGRYPIYEMYFKDKKNNLSLKINYQAEALPHWVAQEATKGWLPMGLGLFRYGFIPKGLTSGTIQTNNKSFSLRGKGYFEHVWGDFSFKKPLNISFSLKKIISIYAKLFGWWRYNNRIHIPKSIMLSTENNPFGNDWAWALFENGWTIFYGNILFWVMEGPATGILILSKDGKNYTEFGNIHFKYKKIRYAKDYDFVYPSKIELTAQKGKEKLFLCLEMTSKSREFVERYSGGKYWLGLVVCETPGKIEGYYSDGSKKVRLSGVCKMEPQRQISRLGHNTMKVDLILPPNGVGLYTELSSHFLKKKINVLIRLVPNPSFGFRSQRF